MTLLQRHIDLLAGVAALAYAALEKMEILDLGLVTPEIAAGFGLVALGRWYAGVKKRAKANPN